MQHSDAEKIQEDTVTDDPGQGLAVQAELLYLLNIIFLPVIAFIILVVLYRRHKNHKSLLARCHLRQTFIASIWAGIMIVLVNLLIILVGGYDSPWVWLIVIIYLTSIHTVFILLGTFGLTRAMNGKHYHYPAISHACSD